MDGKGEEGKKTATYGAVSDPGYVDAEGADRSVSRQSPARKQPRTAKHLVNSIDAALDDDNCQPWSVWTLRGVRGRQSFDLLMT